MIEKSNFFVTAKTKARSHYGSMTGMTSILLELMVPNKKKKKRKDQVIAFTYVRHSANIATIAWWINAQFMVLSIFEHFHIRLCPFQKWYTKFTFISWSQRASSNFWAIYSIQLLGCIAESSLNSTAKVIVWLAFGNFCFLGLFTKY